MGPDKLALMKVYLRQDDTLLLVDTVFGFLHEIAALAEERKQNNKDYVIAIIDYTPTGATTV